MHKTIDFWFQIVYPVVDDSAKRRGLFILINVLNDRPGAEKDGDLMTNLFSQLGYKCITIEQDDITEKVGMVFRNGL